MPDTENTQPQDTEQKPPEVEQPAPKKRTRKKPSDKAAGKLIHLNTALEAVEAEAYSYLEAEDEYDDQGKVKPKEIPDSVLLKIHAFVQAKKENVDEAVLWFRFIEARIAFLKQQEQNLATMRRRAESLFGRIKDSLRVFLDHGEEDPTEPGKAEGKIYKLWTQRASQPKLVIDKPEELPPEFQVVTCSMVIENTQDGKDALSALQRFVEMMDAVRSLKISEPMPDNEVIRQKLKAEEPVAGAKLVYNRHLRDNSPRNAVVKA